MRFCGWQFQGWDEVFQVVGFKAQLEQFVRSFGWNDINWAAVVSFQLGMGFIGWQL